MKYSRILKKFFNIRKHILNFEMRATEFADRVTAHARVLDSCIEHGERSEVVTTSIIVRTAFLWCHTFLQFVA